MRTVIYVIGSMLALAVLGWVAAENPAHEVDLPESWYDRAMSITSQILSVPDAPGAGVPFTVSPAWIAATLTSVVRLGLGPKTNQADLVILLGSATGDNVNDPIGPTCPNQLGYFYGGAGGESPDVQGMTPCAYYAFVRYPPPAGTGPNATPPTTPTVGATFEMTGSP